jgi:hypothetical protein
MESSALALSIFAVTAAASLLTIWRCRHYRALLSFLLPPLVYVVLLGAAFKFGERFATCDAPDCGPSMFIAIGLFAMTVALGGFAGSVAGVVAGHVLVDRRKGRPVLSALAIGLAVVGGQRVLFSLFTGQPLDFSIAFATVEILFTAIPFLVLALAGRTGLPWALAIAATLCLWAWNLWVQTGFLRTSGGGGDAGLGPLTMSLLVTALVLLVDRRSRPARG